MNERIYTGRVELNNIYISPITITIIFWSIMELLKIRTILTILYFILTSYFPYKPMISLSLAVNILSACSYNCASNSGGQKEELFFKIHVIKTLEY